MPVTDHLSGWLTAVNADPENAHIGRFSHFVLEALTPEGGRVTLKYSAGSVTLKEETSEVAGDIQLRATRRTWMELFDPHAPPRRHDLLSLTKAPDGIEVVSGWTDLVRHLRVLSRLVELGKIHVHA